MPADPDNSNADERHVSVTLERTMKRMGQWEYPSWHIAHVQDLSAAGGSGEPATAGVPPSPERFTWSHLPITLHRDAAEGYWYNLSGNVPSVFVVCCENEDQDDDEHAQLTLTTVTLNHDEAAAHLETDDTVLSIAMPPSLHMWLEQFVERNYKPEKRSKRKRTAWGEDQQDEAERPRAQRPIRGN
ncbi:MAG: DUF3305 domain-containing protein [Gammaproteobacteria bacterium]|nr:DUF3305 domain-containing protein [Gammaproteobacteria bacterium]